MSDHCKLSFKINVGQETSSIIHKIENIESKEIPYKIKWSVTLAERYSRLFTQERNLAQLERFCYTPYGTESIDNAVNDLTNMLMTNATKFGNMIKKTSPRKKRMKLPKWQNKDLISLKKGLLHKAKLFEKIPLR